MEYGAAELKAFLQQLYPEWKPKRVQQTLTELDTAPNWPLFYKLLEVLQQPAEPERSMTLFLLQKFGENPLGDCGATHWVFSRAIVLLHSSDSQIQQLFEKYFAVAQSKNFAAALYQAWYTTLHEEFYRLLIQPDWLELIDYNLRPLLLLKVGRYSVDDFMKENQRLSFLSVSMISKDATIAQNARLLLTQIPDEWLHKHYGKNDSGGYSHYNLIRLLAQIEVENTNLLDKVELLLSFEKIEDSTWYRDFYCELWAETRKPRLGELLIKQKWVASEPLKLKVLTHLKTGQIHLMSKFSFWEIKYLIEFCADPEQAIAAQARQELLNLPENSLDTLGKIWLDERLPLLEEIFAERDCLPRKPPAARVKLALKLQKEKELQQKAGKTNLIAPLAEACEDSDAQVAERARQLLPQLVQTNANQQILLCQAILEEEYPFAEKLALEQNYSPPKTEQRLLFFFLTRQWERYEALDYDFRGLRLAYETGNGRLRQRIAAAIRQSGRADYLTVISGGETRTRAAVINLQEAEVIVRNLSNNRDWPKLWELVFELPLHWSVAAVRQLAEVGWQPDRAEDRGLLNALQEAARGEIITTEAEAVAQLPPAVLRAQMRFGAVGADGSQKINSIAFAATGSRLALGLSSKQVVLWDWQTGKLTTTVNGFNNGVARVAFMPDNSLVCSETGLNWRSRTSVYHWQPGTERLVKLADHTGAITALQPLDEENILWGAQDRQTVKYNLASQRAVATYQSNNTWARHFCLPAHKEWLVLLHDGITILSLADFSLLKYTRFSAMGRPNVLAATLTPNETHLLISRSEKKLGACELPIDITKLDEFDLRYFGAVRPQENLVMGLATLPNLPLIIAATSQGNIELIDWEKRETAWTMQVPAKNLTAFKLSQDGHFMAVADELAGLSLWDLRVLELQRFFAHSLAQGRATHMAALTICEQSETIHQLPAAVKAALRYLRLILERRARFDIELDEISFIQAGTFDIEL